MTAVWLERIECIKKQHQSFDSWRPQSLDPFMKMIAKFDVTIAEFMTMLRYTICFERCTGSDRDV